MKKTLEDYRKGAIGSILDEYERALGELKNVLRNVGAEDYGRVVAGESAHCHSIEVIMNHVVRAGYAYAGYIRAALALETVPVGDRQIAQAEIGGEIDKMFAHTEDIFAKRGETTNDEMTKIYFKTRWDETYNIDQLLEHAIVHVLRHRRQIEKFLLKFEN